MANNYAVYSRAGRLHMQRCSVSSGTGSAVGCDGGSLAAHESSFSGCERHGLVIAGDLDGGAAEVRLQGCTLERNGRSGAVVLDGAEVRAERCSFARNRQYGLDLRVRFWTLFWSGHWAYMRLSSAVAVHHHIGALRITQRDIASPAMPAMGCTCCCKYPRSVETRMSVSWLCRIAM